MLLRKFFRTSLASLGDFTSGNLIDNNGNTLGVSIRVIQLRRFMANSVLTLGNIIDHNLNNITTNTLDNIAVMQANNVNIVDNLGNNLVFGNYEFQTVNQLSYKTRE